MRSFKGLDALAEINHPSYSPGPLAWRRGRYGETEDTPPATTRAGSELIVEGDYLRMHTDELMDLLQEIASHYEDIPKRDYSVEWDTEEDRLLINFADPLLAQAVAKTLYHSCDGQLNFHYSRSPSARLRATG